MQRKVLIEAESSLTLSDNLELGSLQCKKSPTYQMISDFWVGLPLKIVFWRGRGLQSVGVPIEAVTFDSTFNTDYIVCLRHSSIISHTSNYLLYSSVESITIILITGAIW